MNATVLLTGATGFLGTHIARLLLADPQVRVAALVRESNTETASSRLIREWWDISDLRGEVGQRVRVLSGDVTSPNLDLSPQDSAWAIENVTHIIHTAAEVRLFRPLNDLRRVNVDGTRHTLEFARSIHAHHPLRRFSHVSTAYVAGVHAGAVPEARLAAPKEFSSPYERSKYEAEELVWAAAGDLPVSIFRPGMIVGDSRTGEIKTFNTLYYPLKLYLSEKLWLAPASPWLKINWIPVDEVAAAIASLTFHPEAAGLAFHLTPPAAAMPAITQVAEAARVWALDRLGLRLPRARFIPVPGLNRFAALLKNPELSSLASLLPYFFKSLQFDRSNTDRLFRPYPLEWREFLPRLLDYAAHHSYWGRTSRTVHEQVVQRMRSRSRPVVYHDLYDHQVQTRTAAELLADIAAVQSALAALGIQRGSRVALVGLNSTRYFSVQIALGLSGLVSTPFYATCPPVEINSLLEQSQPAALLIGVPNLLQRLDEIQFDGPVISMCRRSPAPMPAREFIAWEQFLSLKPAHPMPPAARVALDEPVSLHFTSGTTGKHKGVLYHHEHYRWLGETLASFFPWRERYRWGSYLSYLPMNHVVEGILASYSPYYVPAALDIYYLEDFQQLQWALKATHPTIFFSVPRFFEKVRASFLENSLAQRYLTLSPGPFRAVLRRLLQTGLRRKTGLDHCKQIIVGSAVSDTPLLSFFRDMGIEIHDAYGLTEAPLVSLNRLGRNRLGTLGEPLPETQIEIAPDDEIRVYGPQVAAGYYENGQLTPFTSRWLSTGDTGHINAEGALVLTGRKKDLLVTGYGKKILPTLIEARLRSIPGVSEALLVGEGRAYCAALLWLDAPDPSTIDYAQIDREVQKANDDLSHAEQVKRWAILPGMLTVEDGALTGSLKLRRGLLTERCADVIDALYAGGTNAPAWLHRCEQVKSP